MELTPTEAVVLGLIAERPRHGYEVEQVIVDRGVREWADIGFSSIYYVLNKLERRGLLTGSGDSASHGRARRVLEVTAAGRAEAEQAAREFVEQVRPVPDPFLVGVANQDLIGDEEYRSALRRRRRAVDERLERLAAAGAAQESLPAAASDLFTYTQCLLEAERSWLTARSRDVR